jgi:signal transduction histidine kinase/ligand-binding sensor domain-containing protein
MPLLALLTFNASGQPANAVFYHLTTKNGLSSNRVTGVIQDRKGYYWIATDDGLNRFDGTNCKVFRHIENDSTSLSSNYCGNLLEDELGNIWVSTQTGISVYLIREGKFKRFYLRNPTVSFERANGNAAMTKDDSGNIFICSYGLWRYNIYSGKWKTFLNNPGDIHSIPFGPYVSLLYDASKKGIWMNGYAGIVFFDFSSETFYHQKNNPWHLTFFDHPSVDANLVFDHHGRIWFYDPITQNLNNYSFDSNLIESIALPHPITSLKRLSIDEEDRVWTHHWNLPTLIFSIKNHNEDSEFLKNYHKQSALSTLSNYLYIDPENNYWICSNEGISIYNNSSQSVHFFIPPNLPSPIISVAEQNDHTFWIGTYNGLFKYSPASNRISNVPFFTIYDDAVRCLFLQNDSILWIGGSSVLQVLNVNNGHSRMKLKFESNPQFIQQDGSGNIWVGSWNDGLFEYASAGILINHISKGKQKRQLYSNSLLSGIFSSQKGNFWVGYNGGNGFSNILEDGNIIEHYKIDPENALRISNTVNCMAVDKIGNLWIGTYGSGLFYFDRMTRQFTNYSQNSGLNGDFIDAVLVDDSARVWISSNNGLNIFDTRTHAIINTDIDLAQNTNDLVANGFVGKNGSIYFFNHEQIVEIDPSKFLKAPYPCSLKRSSFKIFDEEFEVFDSLVHQGVRLSHNQNFFSLEYSLLRPDPGATIEYAYLLDGFDKHWHYIRGRMYANYTNVPPGKYFFRVKAADKLGRWSYFADPFLLIIAPPFWKTWWFILLVAASAFLAIYMLFRYRIAQVHKMYRLRSVISKDLHDEVGATLTSISMLSEVAKNQSGSPERVQNTLDKIGTYSRDMIAEMNDIVWAINPKNDSFVKIIERMQDFAMRLLSSRGIRFALHVDEGVKSHSLSMQQRKNLYLIFKESVNNAAKYAGCTEVKAGLERTNTQIHLEVKDNGVGFSQLTSGHGNGLINMKERAEELNGKFQIYSEPGKGTTIKLIIPITQNAD